MVQSTRMPGGVYVDGHLPTGWAYRPGTGEADLRIEGPSSADGIETVVRVRVDAAAEPIEASSLHLMQDIARDRPAALLANCELWPHRQWGDGRYIQSASVQGASTLAHDVYLFVSDSRRVRVEVDCSLAQLLAVEEAVATIVGRLRFDEVAR